MKWGYTGLIALVAACGESKEAPVFERYTDKQPRYLSFGGSGYEVKYVPFTNAVQCLKHMSPSFTYVAQGQPLNSCDDDEDKARELPGWVLDSMLSLNQSQRLLRYTIDSIRYEELRRLDGAEE
jgi:hypothetical protein